MTVSIPTILAVLLPALATVLFAALLVSVAMFLGLGQRRAVIRPAGGPNAQRWSSVQQP